MHILHTIAGLNVHKGGTSRTTPYLCESLADLGVQVSLMTIGTKEETLSLPDGAKVRVKVCHPQTALGERFQVASAFEEALKTMLQQQKPDVIHDHGVWLWSNWLVSKMAHRYKIPMVISPHGMLMPESFSHKGYMKWASWRLYQQQIIRRANALHVTSETEKASLPDLGITNPVWVIPNAIRLPSEIPSRTQQPSKKALFLSRLHPIKGIMLLLDAWKEANPEGWTLDIVGPDEDGYAAEVFKKIQDCDLTHSVRVFGAADDVGKWALFAASDLFILPSKSENFGIVIAEAMAAGLPVITTTGTPWQVLNTRKMGWWVNPDVVSLKEAIKEGTATPPEVRNAMGLRAREYVLGHFTWAHVAQSFAKKYESLTR